MPSRTHNPEKRAWRGKSYKKGGTRVQVLREATEAEITRASERLAYEIWKYEPPNVGAIKQARHHIDQALAAFKDEVDRG